MNLRKNDLLAFKKLGIEPFSLRENGVSESLGGNRLRVTFPQLVDFNLDNYFNAIFIFLT